MPYKIVLLDSYQPDDEVLRAEAAFDAMLRVMFDGAANVEAAYREFSRVFKAYRTTRLAVDAPASDRAAITRWEAAIIAAWDAALPTWRDRFDIDDAHFEVVLND